MSRAYIIKYAAVPLVYTDVPACLDFVALFQLQLVDAVVHHSQHDAAVVDVGGLLKVVHDEVLTAPGAVGTGAALNG